MSDNRGPDEPPVTFPPGNVDLALLEESLKLTPEQRLREAERLWNEVVRLLPEPLPHFARAFDSFDEYEAWRLQQDRPWLY